MVERKQRKMIKKPNEMNFANKNIIMIISGLPGVGKTTLALSAKNVLLIDADEGICRVKKEHRKDSSICKTYEELLSDLKAAEGVYKTIAIDTCGALIDLIKDWAIRTDTKASKVNGGISLQGFGIVKSEFIRLSNELKKKFNVIFLFHETKSKDNDETFYDIVCEGAAKTLVWQPADLGAHLHIMNGKRYLGFTPTNNYNAKSAYGIKGLVEVPELKDGEANDFLEKLFYVIRQNLAKECEEMQPKQDAYKIAMEQGMAIVNAVTEPEEIKECLKMIGELKHSLTSEKELKAALKAKMAEQNIVYDKETKNYVREK